MIPKIGFGTASLLSWQQDDDKVTHIIKHAIDSGYRYIDTAALYGNERSVGKAIVSSGIPREELYICSKVWNHDQGYDQTLNAFDVSMEKLGLDYLDLYLIHWPHPETTEGTWKAMEKLVNDGRIRQIGVSNFRIQDLDQVRSFATIQPYCNQIELHPYLQQNELVTYCQKRAFKIIAWSPLGTGAWNPTPVAEKPISDPLITNIAEKYDVSNAQVILKWNQQRGVIPIPKSNTPARIEKNIVLENFKLTDAELSAIKSLDKNVRYGFHPDVGFEKHQHDVVPT